MEVKTAKELTAKNLANLESKINQEAPLLDVAFLQTLAANQAMSEASLYKFGNQRILDSLAATASLEGLKAIGKPYGVFLKEAQSAVLNISIPAGDGIEIPATAVFTGEDNGERYFADHAATGAGGFASLSVTAENPGVNANLPDGSELRIQTSVPGADTIALVFSTEEIGAEEEKTELFRRRVLASIRKKAGGGDLSDIREWGEETAGAAAVYPYTGRPWNESPELSVPPERTAYVEADEDIDPDGIAPPALLDAVRQSINFTPEGKSRQTLGMTDEKLYTRSIERIPMYVEIRDLVTPPGQDTQVKTAIEAALETYFLSLRPYIDGLDFEGERNDEITDLSLSKAIQDVLQANNSTATGAGFGTTPAVFIGYYKLYPGQLTKLGLPVVYA